MTDGCEKEVLVNEINEINEISELRKKRG